MRYSHKKIQFPEGLKVGSEIGVLGEGLETFTVQEITDDQGIILNTGCREPLFKIYLLKNGNHRESMDDPSNWIEVAIGECDNCGAIFNGSCTIFTHMGRDLCTGCAIISGEYSHV